MTQHEEYRDKIDSVFSRYSGETAITYLKDDGIIEKYNYGHILENCKRTAHFNENVNLKPGDRVAIVSPHSPEFVMAGVELAWNNITEVLLDASLPVKEIVRLINFSDVQAVLVAGEAWGELSSDFNLDIPVFRLRIDKGLFDTSDLLNKRFEIHHAEDPDRDVAAIIYSSGTTAMMKGIKISYHSILKSAEIIRRNSKWKQKYKYLHVFPFNHIAGFDIAHTILLSGSELGMIEHVNASKLLSALHEYEPEGFGMIPKVYEGMEDRFWETVNKKGNTITVLLRLGLDISGFIRKKFGIKIGAIVFKRIRFKLFGRNIKYIGTGSAPCRESTANFFLDLGLEWGNFYALTETSVPAVMTSRYDRFPMASAGYVKRNPEIDIIIYNPDRDGIGEIRVKSELLTSGYFRDEELTANSFSEGYFKTGDYGYIDNRGYLYVTGRIKESLLLRTGKKVSPSDIDEYYMQQIPGVTLACCGVIGEDGFDVAHMFIQTKELTEVQIQKTEQAIRRISTGSSALYKISKIHRIDDIPLTTIGKVKRYILCEKAKVENEFSEGILSNNYKNICKSHDYDIGLKTILHHILDEKHVEDDNQPLEYYGLDSLGLMELRMVLEDDHGVLLPDYLNTGSSVKELKNCFLLKTEHTGGDHSDRLAYDKAEQGRKIDDKLFEQSSGSKILYKFLQSLSTKYINRKYIVHTNNIKEGLCAEPLIFAPNHRKKEDSIILFGAIPNRIHWAAINRHFEGKEGIFGDGTGWLSRRLTQYLFVKLGMVPIDREGDNSKSLNIMRKFLMHGESVGVYPEGTTNKHPEDQRLVNINMGAFALAKATGCDIQPVGIVWQNDESGRESANVCFGKIITDCKNKTIEKLKEEWELSITEAIIECENECM